MTQTTFDQLTTQERKNDLVDNPPEGLVMCLACDHLVPKTLICLWCGAKLEMN